MGGDVVHQYLSTLPPQVASRERLVVQVGARLLARGMGTQPITNRGTALRLRVAPAPVEPKTNFSPRPAPLFRMCTGDYAALFGAFILAELGVDGPVPLWLFHQVAGIEAWEFCRQLDDEVFEGTDKATHLFPTGERDSRASWDKYTKFALCENPGAQEGKQLHGCLFHWGVLALRREGRGWVVGITAAGLELLEKLDGLLLDPSSQKERVLAFTEHLAQHAGGDLTWMIRMCQCASEKLKRPDAQKRFGDRGSKDALSSYLPRCRNWGLVKRQSKKEAQSGYLLTPLGREVLDRYRGMLR